MSTTTQILFNSPALNSLKRDQLVKLCKIHSIKANGKNKDLVERLQLHAQTLPPDDPLSVAVRGDKDVGEQDTAGEESSRASAMTRPSEQWEIVMDSIAEVDEEATSTLKNNQERNATQAGEFGTNGGKVSSVGSSLKAIATSLGLKRGNASSETTTTASSKSSLASTKSGKSQSTAPTEPEPEIQPVPGQNALAGLPAPDNARLSISQAPATTTIRLVASNAPNDSLFSPPRLHPFKTSFDLVPQTPGGAEGGGIWPLSPGGAKRERIYPDVPTFSAFEPVDISDMDIDVDFPGTLQSSTPARSKFNTGATPRSDERPSDVPKDLFSPAPRLTRAREDPTSSRPQRSPEKPSSELGIPRSEPFIFGSPNPQHRLSNAQFRSAAQSVLDDMNARLKSDGVASVDFDVLKHRQQSVSRHSTAEDPQQEKKASSSQLFDKAHQAQFDKMDSITSHYAARRGLPSNAEAAPVLGKRKTATEPATITGKTRKSSVVVKKDRVPSTSSVRLRPVSKKVVPGGFGDDDDDDGEEDGRGDDRQMFKRARIDPTEDAELEKEEAKRLKEREAIRRKLDANKAKRRSSMGRPSIGKGAQTPKQAPRFGFFSSAKNLVSNVWNRGTTGSKPNITAAKPAPAPTKTLAPSISSKVTKEPSKAQSMSKKPSIIPGSSTVPPVPKEYVPSDSDCKRMPPGSSLAPVADSTSSRTSKSPIQFPASGTSSRKGHSRTNSASSLGVASRTNDAGHVSSMGSKTSLTGTLRAATIGTVRARASTLMAPTASSLAKTSRLPVPSFSPLQVKDKVNEKGKRQEKETDAVGQGVISPMVPRSQGGIFSQPLTLISPSSEASGPQPPVSLAAAVATLAGTKPPIPPKPKVMPGRRPRISRGKVIAKLASQREAQQAGASAIPRPRVGASNSHARLGLPRVRSSMSINVGQSHSVTRVDGDVLMSAKKHTRRSEYARRRSRVDGEKMDLDVKG